MSPKLGADPLWVCDFTYVATWSGFAYTALVIDVHSRMIVGWRTAATMTADLVTDALDMAIFSRRTQLLRGVIAHSDAGSQGELNRSSQDRLVGWIVDGERPTPPFPLHPCLVWSVGHQPVV